MYFITEYTLLLEEAFSKLVKQYNQLQLSEYSTDTIEHGNTLITNGVMILKSIKSHCITLETLLSDCSDFVKELAEEPPKNNSIYVYKNKNNTLSYPGKSSVSIIDTYDEELLNKKKTQVI